MPPGVVGRCQGLWPEGRMGILLPNGLTPAYSRDIWLGYSDLILALLDQVFPLLGLLVSAENLAPSSRQLFFFFFLLPWYWGLKLGMLY